MRRTAVTTLLAVVALRGLAACVDGVTPDCSNAAVCAPIEGATNVTTDASTSTTSDASDASTTTPDAANAADAADAADGG